MSALAEKIADPFFAEENPIYVVGRSGEKRSHYVRATKSWATAVSFCEQEPGTAAWNPRTSTKNMCQACHAAACRMPCAVKKVPDSWFNRPWYGQDRGRRA